MSNSIGIILPNKLVDLIVRTKMSARILNDWHLSMKNVSTGNMAQNLRHLLAYSRLCPLPQQCITIPKHHQELFQAYALSLCVWRPNQNKTNK